MQKHPFTGKMDAQTGSLNVAHPIETDWIFVRDGHANHDYAKYVEGVSLVNMVREDLAAQRIDLGCCRDIIQYLGDHDPDTRRMLEGVLAMEGERAGEPANRLKV